LEAESVARGTQAEIAALEALRREIEIWRKTRAKVGPMAEGLWSAATKLGNELGIGKVADVLGLGYYALRKRATGVGKPLLAKKGESVEGAHGVKGIAPKFVEVQGAEIIRAQLPSKLTRSSSASMTKTRRLGASGEIEVVAEFAGRRVSVRMVTGGTADVVKLLESVWGGH
jgi:hypothetical protein